MADRIYDKHQLSDGRSVWIQHTVIAWAEPGEHKPWALVIAEADGPPTIERRDTNDECLDLLADVLRDDICETF